MKIKIPHLSYTVTKSNCIFIRLDGNEWYDREKATQLRKELNVLNPAFKCFWDIKLDNSYTEGVVLIKLQDELHSALVELELNSIGILPWRNYMSMKRKHGYCEEDLSEE